MAFIKRFKNGRPIDPTIPDANIPSIEEKKVVIDQKPTLPIEIKKAPSTIKTYEKKGGCGCGKK